MVASWVEIKAARAGREAVREGYEDARLLHETGDKIRAMRLAAGLSQRELSNISGVSASSISRLESGESMPNLAALNRLSRALGATLTLALEPGAAG